MDKKTAPRSVVTIVEEILNSISHGMTAATAVVGLILGIVFLTISAPIKVGFIIYAVSLIILMLASTLYHALIFTKARNVFRAIDHSSIFILIAGSFTPFIIYLYSGWERFVFLAVVWLFATSGIALTTTLILPRKMNMTGVLLYIGFGWMGLLLIPKIGLVSSTVVWLLFAGGILYTIGTIPFAFKKPFAHFSWHLFVIAAAVVQFFAIIKLT